MNSLVRVVQIEHTQRLELDTENIYSERVVTRVMETGDALTSGWLRMNFSKNPVDYLVLHGILHHTRPLVGEDFEHLQALSLVTLDDKGRLYARITDLALAELLGVHRTTIAAAAQRLSDKGLIRTAQIPDHILRHGGLRDSHGKFEGNCIYFITGNFGNAITRDMQSRQSVLEEEDYDVGFSDTVTDDRTDGASQASMGRYSAARYAGQMDGKMQFVNQQAPISDWQSRLTMPGQPTGDVGQTDINESFKESRIKESVDGPSSDSIQDSSLDSKEKLLADLRAVGVYSETAAGLLRDFPETEVRAWLELLPSAMEAGYANSPGWIPTVLRRQFEYNRVKANIARKLAIHTPEPTGEEQPAESILPEDVIEDIRAMGWSDSLTLVEKCWQEDPDRVDDWIAYILKIFDDLENPPGRLRRGLESGGPPPVKKKRWKGDLPSATRYRHDPYKEYYA